MKSHDLRGEVLVDFQSRDVVDHSIHGFEVTWSDLYYHVYPSKFEQIVNTLIGQRRKSVIKTILRNCAGSIKSGRLTAIMGPSGSGKSTFLKCLAALQVSGLEGNIRLSGSLSKITLAYLPQDDQLVEVLTVREAITYAYQLKRDVSGSSPLMDKNIGTLMSQLGLTDCADRRIEKISGGQKKRVSIAQELTNSPDMLLLDEPTSGLDSSSCFQLLEALNSVVKQAAIALVISIHQPSAHAFSALHDVYMLSHDGQMMYHDQPHQVVSTLASVGIKVDQFNNPVDVLTEVAIGAYGHDAIEKLVQLVEKRSLKDKESVELAVKRTVNDKSLHDCLVSKFGSSVNALTTLTNRHFHFNTRDRLGLVIRLGFSFQVVILLATIFPKVGLYDGCLPNTVQDDLKNSRIDSVHYSIANHLMATRDNLSCFFFSLIFVILINLMPLSAKIPMFEGIFTKEYCNGWYNKPFYFCSHFLAELPFSTFFSVIGYTGQYLFTSQMPSRFWSTALVYLLISIISQIHGLILGIVLMKNILASVFAAPNSLIPLLLFSGFFIQIHEMPHLYQKFSTFSYVRYGFEGMVASVFGYERCADRAEAISLFQDSKNQLHSFMDSMFKIARNDLGQMISFEDSQLLTNQTETLTNSIVNSLNGPYFGHGTESGIMSFLRLTDDHYYNAIEKLTLTIIIELILICIVGKFTINRRQ